jgi:hypothetical protein
LCGTLVACQLYVTLRVQFILNGRTRLRADVYETGGRAAGSSGCHRLLARLRVRRTTGGALMLRRLLHVMYQECVE